MNPTTYQRANAQIPPRGFIAHTQIPDIQARPTYSLLLLYLFIDYKAR